MKVEGPKGPRAPDKAKKAGGSSATGDGRFGAMVASGSSESVKTQATQSLAQVDALLAIQGAEDPTAKSSKKRMRQRANTILDALEKVRMAMLGGQLTVGHMIDVADVVASHREKISDPEMTALMDEIDLRAQVELAKMRVTLDKRAQEAKSR